MTQQQALEIIKSGHNVLLTGAAGSGKSFLLNQYISHLKEQNIPHGVTASTGIAATHINGRTIHSWCGMGTDEQMTDLQIKHLLKKDYLQNSIIPAEVLIIDEISMLNANQLDLVDRICKAFKHNNLPFGGIHVLLCGDFFQLPPISRGQQQSRFVVESRVWQEMDIRVCYLEEQHRQNDKDLLFVLKTIRNNEPGDGMIRYVLGKRYKQPVESTIKPTILHTHNIEVDGYNKNELAKLKGKEYMFEMRSEGIPRLVEALKKNCLAPEQLVLKKKAVVMFLKNNFEAGYVNGTLGIVKGFDKDSGYPIIETTNGNTIYATPDKWTIEENGKALATITQVPLRLAWAITVHKSQGMTLDCAEMDLSKTFEYGMGYVALSRVRSLNGINLLGLNTKALMVSDRAVKIDTYLREKSQQGL